MRKRSESKYLPNGAYSESYSESADHELDTGVADGILDVLGHSRGQTIADFGCGIGLYIRHFGSNHVPACGFDGSPKIDERTGYRVLYRDLAQPFDTKLTWDFVMSLDCGCYIPAAKTATFIKNCCSHAKIGVIIAWPSEDVPTPLTHEALCDAMAEHGFAESIPLGKLISRKAKKRRNRHRVKVFLRSPAKK